MKEKLKEIWKIVYVDFRVHKNKLINNYSEIMILCNGYSTLGMEKEYKKYNELAVEYERLIKSANVSIQERFFHDGSMFSWIIAEFVASVVKITDIELERKINKNDSLYSDEYKKACKIVYIVHELIKDADEKILDNNLEMIQVQDRIEYRVKGITLFTDSVFKIDKNILYHGTTLYNAKNIIGMNKLLSKKYDGVDGFYNKDKIFFTESMEDSKRYAQRNKTDDVHIILKVDVRNISLYLREHLIVEREGQLYFANQDTLDLTDRILNVYMIKDNQLKEISKEEIVCCMSSSLTKYDTGLIKEIDTLKKQLVKLTEVTDEKREKFKKKIMAISTIENITPKEVFEKCKLDEKLYRYLFEEDEVINTLEKHIQYLKSLDVYKNIEYGKKVDIEVVDENVLYHGTSIESAKGILSDGVIKPSDDIAITHIDYNKVFLSDNINYTKPYGEMRQFSDNHGRNGNSFYIIFEFDTSSKTVYSFIENEFFIWGHISTDCIKHIYLCKKDTIIKEISKDELLGMELSNCKDQ